MTNTEAVQSARHIARAMGSRTGLAFGGMQNPPFYARREASGEDQSNYGLIQSTVPGRTDRHNADLAAGSYVLPADVVAGLGEGNTMAGAAIIDRMMHSAPYGIEEPKFSRQNTQPRPPSPYQSADGNYITHQLTGNVGGGSGYAKGGATKSQQEQDINDHGKVPTVLAGGEFILPPYMIARHPLLGNADPRNPDPEHYRKALKHGHRVLDAWVKMERAKQIKTLTKLPGPKK